MAIDRGNGTTTQLLTLLNVSATKAGKRKWLLDDLKPTQKLNKRRTVQFEESPLEGSNTPVAEGSSASVEEIIDKNEAEKNDEDEEDEEAMDVDEEESTQSASQILLEGTKDNYLVVLV